MLSCGKFTFLQKPVLASARSQSAGSEKTDPNSLLQTDDPKPTVSTMMSVLTSLNKMKIIRERTQAAKGNITRDRPLRKFCANEVSQEIDRILATALVGVTYDPTRAGILSKSLSETIKANVKSMKFPRYKFVVLVTISSQSGQSMISASQCLWNADCDSYATGTYCNNSLVAIATVFAIFKE